MSSLFTNVISKIEHGWIGNWKTFQMRGYLTDSQLPFLTMGLMKLEDSSNILKNQSWYVPEISF